MTPSDETKLVAMRDYINKLANATASFASRTNVYQEPDTGRSLQMIGDVELQKLGVVPHTVFLKSRSTELLGSGRSSKISISSRRPGGGSTASRTPILSPRTHRSSTADLGGAGAPFEDLRRRLATINGSASSVSISAANTPRDAKHALSPIANSSATSLSNEPNPSPSVDRPPSPTESIVSTTNSVSLRPGGRLQIGSMDGQKAAPAIGSSKANATGLLEAHFKLGSPDESGRSSPVSMSATLRPHRIPRVPSSLTISTYGSSIISLFACTLAKDFQDGQEPGISNLLENLYLDNDKELQQDFGPRVHEGPVRRRNAPRQQFTSRDNTQKRIEATLISNLSSHSEAVTDIAVSPDHMFFVTSSDDKTVKIWDSARLERNVTSKPRHTYGQHHARVKCVCTLEGVHCFASAADDGSLHIVRVPITQSGPLPKYSKLQVVREHRVENPGEYIVCMTHYNTGETLGLFIGHIPLTNPYIETASNLVYATTHSNIVILDLRTMRILQSMENPRHFGPITAMCMDKKRVWIVVGTLSGVLSLWDKRFGILIRSWHVGTGSSSRQSRIHQCVVHPTKGKGKWVMVALEAWSKGAESSHLVEVWDIETAVMVESFVTRSGSPSDPISEPEETPGTIAEASPASAIASLVRSRQGRDGHGPRSSQGGDLAQQPSPDVRTLVVGTEFGGFSSNQRADVGGAEAGARSGSRGFMITGSDDWKIRLWDLGRLERTTILSGLQSELEKPSYE